MKLTFIGCGSAFSKNNYNSNMVIEDDGHRMMIDCGRTAPEALTEAGMSWHDIEALYISHQHCDHIGGIEEFAFMRFFAPKGLPKPKIIANEKLMEDLWNESLKGGLASIEGQICTLDTYFEVQKIGINKSFEFSGVEYTPIQTVHVMNGYYIVPSYGLIFTTKMGKKLFISTDSQFCPNQITKFYKWADIIFHDCETSKFKSGVHANYMDLMTLPEDIKKKMFLYHYQDGDLPDALKNGFSGFVKKGEVFEL